MRRKVETTTVKLPEQISRIGRVIETVFSCDIWEEYKELKAKLRIGEGHADYYTVLRANDEAEANYLRASRLLANAELELKKFMVEHRKTCAAMRSDALKSLKEEKLEGSRTKTITNQDLDDYAAVHFHDLWTAQETSKVQHEQTIEHLRVLVDAWKSRCRTLQGMVAKVRNTT
jgi:hypothetical protein